MSEEEDLSRAAVAERHWLNFKARCEKAETLVQMALEVLKHTAAARDCGNDVPSKVWCCEHHENQHAEREPEGFAALYDTHVSDRALLRQARDELRKWLLQMHNFSQRNATEDSNRIEPLILALDMRLRKALDEKDCGSPIGGSITFCCERHADEQAERPGLAGHR